jgi:hypothetical protein
MCAHGFSEEQHRPLTGQRDSNSGARLRGAGQGLVPGPENLLSPQHSLQSKYTACLLCMAPCHFTGSLMRLLLKDNLKAWATVKVTFVTVCFLSELGCQGRSQGP